jgi:hypothetical protein
VTSSHPDASPSAASIWMRCPASVTLSRGRVRKPSIYTREGTAAHHVAELMIHGLKIPASVEVEGETVEVTEEMVEHVQVYVDYVSALQHKAHSFATESLIKLGWLAEPLFGTADARALYTEGLDLVLEIVDLKFGAGVPVGAIQNPQLRVYGLGALAETDAAHEATFGAGESVDRVKLTIVQPRLSGGPGIETETLSAARLRFWGVETLEPAVERIAAGDPTEIPGPHCRWCVRAGECKALAGLALAEAQAAFSVIPSEIVRAMSNDDLAHALDKAELITAWIALVRAEASQRADVGHTIPGWKLAAKRAMRKWTNEDLALVALNDAGAPLKDVVKIVSPAAVERVLKAHRLGLDVIKGLWVKESSGTTLVRDDDPREGLALSAQSMFSVLT